MPINTDLNNAPYFDDFNKEKNFHRILFRPAVAVQARELTQLQTILQDQIEMFGDNILREGTIVSGGNFIEEPTLQFVKLKDLDPNGASFSVSNYLGYTAKGRNSGLNARVVATASGFETQDPNTLWLKYLNTSSTGTTEIKVFLDGENIDIIDTDGTIVGTVVALQSASTGLGYGVRCGEGIVYHKGHFIRFKDELTIVSKYDNKPSGVVVGFETEENIVSSLVDTSLLDNANGFNNFNAPGANRLQLVSSLMVRTLEEAKADEKFFTIQEYSRGKPVRRNLDTVYNKIGDMIAKRTSEESGNYVVSGFNLDAEESTNQDEINLVVGSGVGYVQGYRVEFNGDIVLPTPKGNSAEFINTETNQVISTSYGGYVVCDTLKGVFNTDNFEQVDLYDTLQTGLVPAGNKIGTARIRAVTNGDIGEYRVYLLDVAMTSNESFANVKAVVDAGIAYSNLKKNVIYDNSLQKAVFNVGRTSIANFDYSETGFIYRTSANFVVTTLNTISITPSVAGDELPYGGSTTLTSDQLKDIILIDAATNDIVSLVGSTATTDSTGSQLTITLAANTTAANVVAYFNAQKPTALQLGKITAIRDIAISCATHPNGINGPYSLGMPDVYSIEKVTQNGVDITSSFTLVTNQKDTYYDLSYVTKSGSLVLASTDNLTVTVKAFTKNNTGAFSQSYFTVDSYQDVDIESIPLYTTSTGEVISLRDAVDFRPYAVTTWVSSATPNPSTSINFYGPLNFPAPTSYVTASYSYYVGRYDNVILDQYGNVSVVQGYPSENPVRPPDHQKTMTLGTFYIPPYPALPSRIANKMGLPQYAVKIAKRNNKRYTMADIRGIDNRIENLEYYTSLSLLETKTKELSILDANGLTRFKNGIYADTFRDLMGADITNRDFAAGIDLTEESIHPQFRTYPLNLTPSLLSGVDDSGEAISLKSIDNVIIDQPYVTSFKNCTTGLYNYKGEMFMFPEVDAAPDVVTAPDISINIDLATPFAEFTNALAQIIPMQRTTTNRRTSTSANSRTITTTNTTTSLNVGSSNINTEINGDFITDLEISPWLRAREVKVFVSGLRPNTTFWPYFDGKDISEYSAPAFINSAIQAQSVTSETVVTASQIVKSASNNNALKSDARGRLFFIFTIPEETFKVGDRLLEVMDVGSYFSKDAATSYSAKSYTGFNFSVERTGLSASTRMPEVALNRSSRTRSVSFAINNNDNNDPLIQSFIIDPNSSDDSYTILKGIEVFFISKSDSVGVTVMLREMENGIPTSVVVPHSKVHLSTENINISTNGSLSTRFNFSSPIPLRTNTEYGVCIMPDGSNPDFKVAICKTGEVDLITGVSVVNDTNLGMIFTSTNNKTWTPYQNENLKFRLYAAEFTAASGSVEFTPNSYEFFTLNTIAGKFKAGEKVYVRKNKLTSKVGLTSGSNILNGAGTKFISELKSLDWVLGDVAGNPQLIQVTQNGVISDTQVQLATVPLATTGLGSTDAYKAVVGDVSSFFSSASKLILENSSATNLNKFAAGDIVYGVSSGATAVITSVDSQPVSYIQPNIRRVNSVNTRTDLYAQLLNSSGSIISSYCALNDNTYLRTPLRLHSHSNTVSGGNKATFKVDLKSLLTVSPVFTSPVIDYLASNVNCYEFIINNDSTNETKPTGGNALSKYITKMTELADGLDADDFKVLLTGYRPAKTNIEVYVRFMSASDGRLPSEVGWTKLINTGLYNNFSSAADRYDFKEMEFVLPETNTGVDAASYDGTEFVYTDTNSVNHIKFKKFAIKVVFLSEDHSTIPRMKDLRGIALS